MVDGLGHVRRVSVTDEKAAWQSCGLGLCWCVCEVVRMPGSVAGGVSLCEGPRFRMGVEGHAWLHVGGRQGVAGSGDSLGLWP